MRPSKLAKLHKMLKVGCGLRLIARQRAGPKKILGLVFFFLGSPNAPQQVKFYIHDMALISLTASDFPLCSAEGEKKHLFTHALFSVFCNTTTLFKNNPYCVRFTINHKHIWLLLYVQMFLKAVLYCVHVT